MRRRDLDGHSRGKGYSTFEILTAFALVAVLVGAAVPVTSKFMNHRARVTTREELQKLARACSTYFRDTGTVPRSVAQLFVDPSLDGWVGPYLPVIPTDPMTGRTGYEVDSWSAPYTIVTEDDILVIRSRGEDHAPGTATDMEIRVDTNAIRAAITRRRLEVINQAIVRYNGLHQLTDPLPADYPRLLEELAGHSLLSDSPEYAVDAWGASFIESPEGYSPVVRVRSPNL